MATTSILRLRPVPLTRGLFAPFGEVIESEGNPHYTINDGYAERYSDLAAVDAILTANAIDGALGRGGGTYGKQR